MGFDVYGIKPKRNTQKTDEKLYPVYSEIEQLEDWKEQMKLRESLSPEDKTIYWESLERYEEDNPGEYFRNNCWWWRPLWNYVCEECQDILTEEEMIAGCYNDGKSISASKTKKMAKRLRTKINDGSVADYEKEYKEMAAKEDEDSFAKNYPFAEENVKRFAIFLEQSGGIDIC